MGALIYTLDHSERQALVLEGMVPYIQNQKVSVNTQNWMNKAILTQSSYAGAQILYGLADWLDQGVQLQVEDVPISEVVDIPSILKTVIELDRSYTYDAEYDQMGQLCNLSFHLVTGGVTP
ncbi:hypothetical protein RE628_11910 [Paenibacillus sp. D2_2]|uniref:hypothetical protein n=1 Tax=Paenibacillus sp. D2_2 TaxID=3073092 RepID=UPI002816059E|nr:hypothetical protein [Paenibacillus sp. D2_2]WMT42922.1 hypothetical protein RE628_11910 [Paenibacillus sp. D2_2]